MRAAFPDAPDEADTDVCEDGTACHWLASEIWDKRFPQEGTLSPNGRVLTDEMFDAVDMYHDVLRSWPNVVPVCEKAVSIPRIMEGMQGTPDAWAYDPDKKRLYIADLKFGFRFVEVWENWQLICYACGLIDLLQLDDQQVTVEFTIIQPRSNHRNGPVRKWRVRASDLRGQINVLTSAAELATRDPAMCVPNPGCRDCPGRHACDALQNSALTAIETAYAGVPLELEPRALGNELRMLKDAAKKLDARITGLETQADQMLRKGSVIPGWVLAPTFARETWREGTEAEVITLGQVMHVNVTKPLKAITPAQARKVLPSAIVAMYAHKPSTGVKIVPQDPYEARKAFDQ
jgi:hypothetical protein